MDIHGKIRDVLAETVREELGPGHRPLSEDDFMRALQHRGIVDEVMKDLHFAQVNAMITIKLPPILKHQLHNREIVGCTDN